MSDLHDVMYGYVDNEESNIYLDKEKDGEKEQDHPKTIIISE